MQPHEPPLFTPAEAAVLTRLPLKAVNNAIDKKTVPTVGARMLNLHGLISLSLERRLVDRFLPELRREVFNALACSRRNVVSLEGGLLKIDLREPRRDLARALRDLRRARQLVVSDSEIMGGDPVFRGTRVPVHLVAGLSAQGESDVNVLASYPRLTPEMVRLAPIYAAAYPRRGRPRKQPWHDRPPVSRTTRKLGTIDLA
ncbi:uncharacterized protein (DUF433 family) [Nitrospirillum amazonense]|uniref:Uncharacterized protein (DUF433 family) n=1 Tax=Nitrospirillum amazonense TaxID=28077 RepID=A0A560EIW3_9PROT|nr:DUF433 domain-containing protein [Nitrospirillum amazonense]TWB09313.1 uncharacterized protein (DUF433 family) [Nitrospirillum amazonense]